MPISLMGRIRQCELGIVCIITLAACGAADQPAGAPSSANATPVTALSTESSKATLATPTPIPTTPTVQPPMFTPEETIMPDKKPTQSPSSVRSTLQPGATLVPERAAPTNTPIAAAPAPATAQMAPVEVAKADLARRRAVAPDTIRIVEVRDVIWSNPGMGCPQPGMAYKQVPIDGLLIRLESGGQIFEYHSGGSKAPFLCEHPVGGDEPAPASGGERQ